MSVSFRLSFINTQHMNSSMKERLRFKKEIIKWNETEKQSAAHSLWMSWFMKIITCAGALAAAAALCTCSCCSGFALLKQCSSFSLKHPWVMTLIRFWHNLGKECTSPLDIRIPFVPILSPRAAVTASQPRWHAVCLKDLTLAQTHCTNNAYFQFTMKHIMWRVIVIWLT